jgi:hypothetical protein
MLKDKAKADPPSFELEAMSGQAQKRSIRVVYEHFKEAFNPPESLADYCVLNAFLSWLVREVDR